MKSEKEQKKFNISSLIQLIKKEKIHSLHWVKTEIFMLSAEEFLAFAKEDISEKNIRGRINALCNAKRAIENRIDNLIYNYGLYYYAKKNRWTFPMKIEKLSEIDIKIPNVLQNMITSKRNLLEHEYVIPKDQREVEDVIDIAELFLTASEKYMEMDGRALRMINEPLERLHRSSERKRDSYVVFFDFKNNSIMIYKDTWKEELKINDIDEKDTIELIKTIMNFHPSMQVGYGEKEWKEYGFIELAEKWISKENKKSK